MFDVPEQAITAFERIHGLRVTVHDLAGTLWAYVAPHRFHHADPLCLAVKARDGGATCFALEVTDLRPNLPKIPNGRVHVCYAGLVEWVVPVFAGDQLAWVLFAGIRRPSASLAGAVPMGRWRGPGPPWPFGTPLPPVVESGEAQDILEHLRQLAARLDMWASGVRDEHDKHGANFAEADRAIHIRRFVASRHTEPVTLADLADALSLSESRTSHAVRETCGATFQQMLLDARIVTAMGLLRTSNMPVSDVALYSGFRDVAHFHRCFRLAAGLSPGQYRRQRAT